jgi:hypothetical protein
VFFLGRLGALVVAAHDLSDPAGEREEPAAAGVIISATDRSK